MSSERCGALFCYATLTPRGRPNQIAKEVKRGSCARVTSSMGWKEEVTPHAHTYKGLEGGSYAAIK